MTVLAAAPSKAHELRPSFLAMEETAPGVFAVTFKVSTLGPYRLRLEPVFPDQCRILAPPLVSEEAGTSVRRFEIACGGPIGGERIAIEGLRGTVNDVLVRIEALDGTVQTTRVLPETSGFTVAATPGRIDVARTYALLGMQHILLGLDHLLFVLALLLLIHSTRMLLATITAFTVAHSITLALSAVDLARAPQPLVEALVALSIVMIAAEIVRRERVGPDGAGASGGGMAPWVVAFAFGLLHGLGFGGALQEIGLPPGEVPLALLAFNLGVEAGQLLIVGTALATFASLRLLLAVEVPAARHVLGFGIGSVSATWFAQRVGGFLVGL